VFTSIARSGAARLFLSEHTGDASPDTLLHLRVDDIDAVANEFWVDVLDERLSEPVAGSTLVWPIPRSPSLQTGEYR
jgi:hypothetical protein